MDIETLKAKAYVEISTYRVRCVKAIGEEIKIPKNIAKDSGIRLNHISKTLKELKNKNIVECLNEEDRKGRLYRLTEKGLIIYNEIK